MINIRTVWGKLLEILFFEDVGIFSIIDKYISKTGSNRYKNLGVNRVMNS